MTYLRSLLLLLVIVAVGCDKAAPAPPETQGASQERTGADRK